MHVRVLLLSLTTALALPTFAKAAEPKKLSAEEVAARIDALVAARWADRKVTPAPRADDAEWVRRVSLDLAGRIPDILAARDFIEDPGKAKRARLIDKLLASDRYPLHWASVWRNWWLIESNEIQGSGYSLLFEIWLLDQLKKNVPYDSLVKDVLTATPQSGTSPYYFYAAQQLRIENVAASASRLFLGVKLECAQCHNHPFARWKKQQFWEFAAFFSEVTSPPLDPNNPNYVPKPYVPGEIAIPGTDKAAKARYPDGKEAKFTGRNARAALAEWMTAKDNPYFARAAVNRVWEYLMGTGLVEPLDEESVSNPPSHPEVLDLLARQFAANGYDSKYLIKAIALTRAYQLSSQQTHPSQADPRLFGRMRVRGLSPEQLYDSLVVATGQECKEENSATDYYSRARALSGNSPRADFLRRFPNQEKRTEQQTSILQALYLMNGKLVADATSLEYNENLKVIAQADKLRTSRKVMQLYLVVLSRKPTANESERLVKYVDSGGPKKDRGRALCDVFWALLNSSEFCTNH
jgi:hypothetical protein